MGVLAMERDEDAKANSRRHRDRIGEQVRHPAWRAIRFGELLIPAVLRLLRTFLPIGFRNRDGDA